MILIETFVGASNGTTPIYVNENLIYKAVPRVVNDKDCLELYFVNGKTQMACGKLQGFTSLVKI